MVAKGLKARLRKNGSRVVVVVVGGESCIIKCLSPGPAIQLSYDRDIVFPGLISKIFSE
jgi:hypothetical protein